MYRKFVVSRYTTHVRILFRSCIKSANLVSGFGIIFIYIWYVGFVVTIVKINTIIY